MKTIVAFCAMFVGFAQHVFAAEANELTAKQSIRIAAPADVVWSVLGDFNGQPRWLTFLESSEIVVGTNNEVGCIRLIKRRDGSQVTERLLEYDPYNMRMAYTYVDGAVLASDYFPVLSVKDAGGGSSVVEWSAHFKRLHYAVDPPPAGEEDQAQIDFYNGRYKAGLESLKRVIETAR